MKINNQNYKQLSYFILFLVLISSFVVYLIDYLLKNIGIIIPFYISIPSISGVYALLFYLFDNFFWKFPIFRKLGIIIAYDLNGEWIGSAKSSYDKFEKDFEVILRIQQTATKIVIRGLFNKSKSVSVISEFAVSDIDDGVALFYFYRNEPKYDAVETMAMHEGSTKLIYNKEDNSLTGSYYSGRDRNNFGTIRVVKKTNL